MAKRVKPRIIMPANATDSEWLEFVDAIMNHFYSPIGKFPYDYTSMGDLWSPRGLITLSEHPDRWCPLTKMHKNLSHNSRYHFFHEVFRLRNFFSPKDILTIWYINFYELRYIEKFPAHAGLEEHRQRMFDNPMLLENTAFCASYAEEKQPGWELFQYVHGRRFHTLRIPETLRNVIRKDDIPSFCLARDMSGIAMSYSFLKDIVESHAISIFSWLLDHDGIPQSIITPVEMACWFTVSLPDSHSVPFLQILENHHPGILKNFRDPFGRNLLWFVLYNKQTGWFHPKCKLTAFLRDNGCDTHNTNRLGWGWQELADSLTVEQRRSIMENLYWYNSRLSGGHHQSTLQQEQPLADIRATPQRI